MEVKCAPVPVEKPAVEKIPTDEKAQHKRHGDAERAKSSQKQVKRIAEHHWLGALIEEHTEKDLPERTQHRADMLRQRQQANLERILKMAYESCQDESAREPDPDWLTRFFDAAQNISGTAMQRLWAQILKLEVMQPGATSLKALSILRDLTHREAQLLQRACALATSFGNESSRKIITGYRVEAGWKQLFKPSKPERLSLGDYQLSYSSLMQLVELGLIMRTELESGVIEMHPPMPLHYHNKQYMLTPVKQKTRILYYRFSPVGNELARLVGRQFNQNYLDDVINLLAVAFEVESGKGSQLSFTI